MEMVTAWQRLHLVPAAGMEAFLTDRTGLLVLFEAADFPKDALHLSRMLAYKAAHALH